MSRARTQQRDFPLASRCERLYRGAHVWRHAHGRVKRHVGSVVTCSLPVSMHFPVRLPSPGKYGPSMAPARLGLAVQSAARLWLQPGGGVGPAPGGVDTAPCCPAPLTVQRGRAPCSLAHAAPPGPAPSALHAGRRHRARACSAQGEDAWPRSQGTSAVSGRGTRRSGGGPGTVRVSAVRPVPSEAAQPPQPASSSAARGGRKPALPFADLGQMCSAPFYTVLK